MTLRLSDLDREVPLEAVWEALEALKQNLGDCYGIMEEEEQFVSLADARHTVDHYMNEIVRNW